MRFSLIVLATLLVGFAAAAPVLQSDIFKDTQKADRAQNLVHRLMVRVSTVYSQCTHNCEDEYARYKM
ncbi:BQ5605_C077g12945 [Microbotryum silenes-dioicae]|uniref:BQ5605_C050g12463 protein n=1 Tax=Microbotryum silenes-dioicae TaxID=796604 RepID=A0A2X0PPN4_9BASI|nr:BQ5605_C095g13084 [Microbotryum silenes-dioicae]SGY28619.1 BQ5605_C084g12996 [Microbotryum silenes-dioicae]SGZ10235.1 BQ5605_C109g13207 [Microbotryum silenes-dioicae]SGZ29644.1 BQ5605_C050g12463 [Microbotryum silenes-dioicae]SGZ34536.1 BQ5605_C077g12945 [Microbotryum silenes-dioicae]